MVAEASVRARTADPKGVGRVIFWLPASIGVCDTGGLLESSWPGIRLWSSAGMECERERDRRGEGRAGSYMVPRGPAQEVADPVALGVGAVRFDPSQRFVSWHVVGDGQQYRADRK